MLNIQYLLELHSIILSLGILLFYHWVFRNKDKGTNMLAWIVAVNAAVLFWDMIAYLYQGRPGEAAAQIHCVSNYCLFAMEYLEGYMMARYIHYLLLTFAEEDYWFLTRLAGGIEVVLFSLLIANPFTGCFFYFDEANYYHRGYLGTFNFVVQLLAVFICFRLVIKHRRQLPQKTYRAVVFYFVFPMIGIVLQMLIYGFSFFNVFTTISVIAFLQVRVSQINEEHKRREEILRQTRSSLLSAQMNPHFIFNALSVIGYLMDEDVDQAHEALMQFSRYLRTMLENVPKQTLATIEEEIEFVKEYVYIEKLRFGDDLEVLFDLEELDAKLPYLTIEPLVENAIKHGIRGRAGKGTVRVSSRKEKGQTLVRVEDNGAGFYTEILTTEKFSRVGLNNVKERLQLLCSATLEISSEPGKGTCVEIRIPEVEE